MRSGADQKPKAKQRYLKKGNLSYTCSTWTVNFYLDYSILLRPMNTCTFFTSLISSDQKIKIQLDGNISELLTLIFKKKKALLILIIGAGINVEKSCNQCIF